METTYDYWFNTPENGKLVDSNNQYDSNDPANDPEVIQAMLEWNEHKVPSGSI